jgi:hypothetical protein
MAYTGFDPADGETHPLWREPAFGFTLLAFGLAAAALPIAVAPAPMAWPAAGLVLLAVLAVADLGAVAPAAGARSSARRSLGFALGGAVLPMLIGFAADAAGLGPGARFELVLLGAGALLSLGAIAPLEGARPPEEEGAEEGARARQGRLALLAGAAFSFATAPFARPLVDGAAQRVAAPPRPWAWYLAALAVALLFGALVATAGLAGGTALRQLRFRSFRAPRAAAAALLLGASGGIVAVACTWF